MGKIDHRKMFSCCAKPDNLSSFSLSKERKVLVLQNPIFHDFTILKSRPPLSQKNRGFMANFSNVKLNVKWPKKNLKLLIYYMCHEA